MSNTSTEVIKFRGVNVEVEFFYEPAEPEVGLQMRVEACRVLYEGTDVTPLLDEAALEAVEETLHETVNQALQRRAA
jgi:hypothetical protein